MLISPAWAEAVGEVAMDAAAIPAAPSIWAQIMPLLLIFAVFYFLLIRPQQKKLKDHISMVAALRRGDKVVTGGGIIGTIHRVVDDTEVIVEVAEGVRLRVMRHSISDVMSKSPVSEVESNDGDAAATAIGKK